MPRCFGCNTSDYRSNMVQCDNCDNWLCELGINGGECYLHTRLVDSDQTCGDCCREEPWARGAFSSGCGVKGCSNGH